ncbi:MFS transporter, partial [Acinetobacter baumannii]
ALSTMMTAAWQLIALWGLVVGCGSGIIAMTLGATSVNRWFAARRGLVMGILSASSATGQLVFLPALAWTAEHYGWRAVAWAMVVVAAAMIP